MTQNHGIEETNHALNITVEAEALGNSLSPPNKVVTHPMI